MTEKPQTPMTATPTEDDRLWGMLAWLPAIGWIFAILILVMEDRKSQPFQRFHAVNALGFSVLVFVINTLLSLTGVGILISCPLSILLLLYQIYMAVQAYQGNWSEVPWFTNFAKQQGWI